MCPPWCLFSAFRADVECSYQGWKRRASSSSSFPSLGFHLLLKSTQGMGGLSVQSSSLQLSLSFKELPDFFCTTHLVPVSSQKDYACSPSRSLPAQTRHLARLVRAGVAVSLGRPHMSPSYYRRRAAREGA